MTKSTSEPRFQEQKAPFQSDLLSSYSPLASKRMDSKEARSRLMMLNGAIDSKVKHVMRYDNVKE